MPGGPGWPPPHPGSHRPRFLLPRGQTGDGSLSVGRAPRLTPVPCVDATVPPGVLTAMSLFALMKSQGLHLATSTTTADVAPGLCRSRHSLTGRNNPWSGNWENRA